MKQDQKRLQNVEQIDYLCDGKSVTMAFDVCDLLQLRKYLDIAAEVTDISCPLSLLNLEVQSNGSNKIKMKLSTVLMPHAEGTLMFWPLSISCRTCCLARMKHLTKILYYIAISSLIVYLQAGAMKLLSIRKQLDKTCCVYVIFTGKQYELLYFSRLHKKNTFSSLCEKARVWQNKTNVCSEWTKYI